MELTDRIENKVYIVSLKGDFGIEGVTQFREDVQLYIEDPATNAMVLNLNEVTYLDSSALGIIIFLHKQLIKHQKKFVLCHLSTKINDVFQMTHLDRVLRIYSTEEEALQALE